MTTTANILQELVTDLKNLGGIEACVIVSRDGLLMSSDIPDGIIDETFDAMSATVPKAAETTTIESTFKCQIMKGIGHNSNIKLFL